jgi:sugar lactone lactonase YvrE
MDNNDQIIYIADCRNHRIVQLKLNSIEYRIVAGGNRQGNEMNQLNNPSDVIIDQENNSLIIADSKNRRIMRWSRHNSTNGEILISNIDCFQLIMDKNQSLYVSDWMKHEVRQWKREEKGNGTIVAGGNGKGDQFNQLNSPTYLFIDENDSLYISDQNNHRVMKWLKDAKEGIVVAGGNGQGNSLKQLSRPTGVIVDQLGQIYVSDYDNHRVMCWYDGANEGTIVVGGNGKGQQTNQFNGPGDLFFDSKGNLYVVDYENNRIQKFEIDTLID